MLLLKVIHLLFFSADSFLNIIQEKLARPRIAFHNFDCKLNFSQIASVSLEFDNKKIGLQILQLCTSLMLVQLLRMKIKWIILYLLALEIREVRWQECYLLEKEELFMNRRLIKNQTFNLKMRIKKDICMVFLRITSKLESRGINLWLIK